jgi:hypothetical protein
MKKYMYVRVLSYFHYAIVTSRDLRNVLQLNPSRVSKGPTPSQPLNESAIKSINTVSSVRYS